MRRHMVRALAAVVAGGGALLTAGLAGVTAAGAATPASQTAASKVIYTNNQAGYKAEGRWFRFVATTVKVPAAGAYSHSAEVALMGGNVSPVYLAVKAGGGANSVAWSVGVHPFGTGGGVLSKVVPKAGDTVLIDLYYNRSAGGVVATATDLTTKATQAVTISEGTSATFNAAQVAGVLANPASPPTGDIRLWQFNQSAVTTNTGVHGTMTGPWTTNTVVDTTNGHGSGQLVMSPSSLFNGGASFGAWIRAWLMKTGS
jgi:hypothetical protein